MVLFCENQYNHIGTKIPDWSISILFCFRKVFSSGPNFGGQLQKKVFRTTFFVGPFQIENMNKLSKWTKLAYGLGHVHNDIAATICFSFSLLYMQVSNFSRP